MDDEFLSEVIRRGTAAVHRWRESHAERLILAKADLSRAKLRAADLSGADCVRTIFDGADLQSADLRDADLRGASLKGANLRKANLGGANLMGADFTETDLANADLHEANLMSSLMVRTNISGATLEGCRVFGISAWDVRDKGSIQSDLVVTDEHEPAIRVDDIRLAQFLYTLQSSETPDTLMASLSTKVVLIVGGIADVPKGVLDGIAEQLRRRQYVPVKIGTEHRWDWQSSEAFAGLAHLCRFIVADISTEPIQKEIEQLVRAATVPIVPIAQATEAVDKTLSAYLAHLRRYRWVLPTVRYSSEDDLLAQLSEKAIDMAEERATELEDVRRMVDRL